MKLLSIEGRLIALYPLALDHIESYLQHYSSVIQTWLHVPSLTQERNYLEDRLQDPHAFFYVISEKISHHIIGALEVRNPVYRSQLYCWINERYWGKGHFQEAMQLFAALYFKTTGQPLITARVDCNNKRSFQALKKVGFYVKKVVVGPYGQQHELILKNIES